MKLERFFELWATAYDPTTGKAETLTKQPTRHETKAEAIRHGERLRAKHEWAGYIIERYNLDGRRVIRSKRKPYRKPSILEEREAAAIESRPNAGGRPMSEAELADIWEALDDMGADQLDEADPMKAIEAYYREKEAKAD